MTAIDSREPVLLHEGTFALYGAPDGSMHLAIRFAAEDEDRHLHVPVHVARMAEKMLSGDMQLPWILRRRH